MEGFFKLSSRHKKQTYGKLFDTNILKDVRDI